MQISRQAVYRTPRPRRLPQRRPVSDPVDLAIVETAKSTSVWVAEHGRVYLNAIIVLPQWDVGALVIGPCRSQDAFVTS